MKKIILINILVIIMTAMNPLSALAVTKASLSPTNIRTSVGQRFDMIITVDPQGTSNYAEKVVIIYPTDILEVDNFILSSDWMALTQPGYDSIDNDRGVLIKTAGYPNGITSTTKFGKISFHVKGEGEGAIALDGTSLAFEADEQSAIKGDSVSIFVLNSSSVATAMGTSSLTAVTSGEKLDALDREIVGGHDRKDIPENTTEQIVLEEDRAPQLAQASTVLSSRNSNAAVFILNTIAVLGITVYLFLQKKKKISR